MQKRNPIPIRAGRLRVPLVILLALLTGGVAVLFRQGLVPSWLSPLPALDLASTDPWLIDWRLAEIRYHPELCKRVLKAPHIEAQPIADSPLKNGCGWHNAVRMTKAGNVHAAYDKVTCETAVALALWLEHDVQPVAEEIFKQRVVSIQSFGSYACRNIVGNSYWKDRRSEHATANAVDISGFNLSDGRRIGVARYWKGNGDEARFLRAVHDRACRYFRVAIGPDYNEAHHDHFHLDRGLFSRCK
jgi:hypothetical protein